LISVAFDRGSALLGQIRQAGRFGVNLLGHAQDELAMTFARRGEDRFAAADWFADDELPRQVRYNLPVEVLYTLMGPGCNRVTNVSEKGVDVVTGHWKDGRVATDGWWEVSRQSETPN